MYLSILRFLHYHLRLSIVHMSETYVLHHVEEEDMWFLKANCSEIFQVGIRRHIALVISKSPSCQGHFSANVSPNNFSAQLPETEWSVFFTECMQTERRSFFLLRKKFDFQRHTGIPIIPTLVIKYFKDIYCPFDEVEIFDTRSKEKINVFEWRRHRNTSVYLKKLNFR